MTKSAKKQSMFPLLLLLPLTIVLDALLFAFLQQCPSCGSFGQFLQSNNALSFPFLLPLMEWSRKRFSL